MALNASAPFGSAETRIGAARGSRRHISATGRDAAILLPLRSSTAAGGSARAETTLTRSTRLYGTLTRKAPASAGESGSWSAVKSPYPSSSHSNGSTPGGGIDNSRRTFRLRAKLTARSYSKPSMPPRSTVQVVAEFRVTSRNAPVRRISFKSRQAGIPDAPERTRSAKKNRSIANRS